MRPVQWLLPVPLLLALDAGAEEPKAENPAPVCRILTPASSAIFLPGRAVALSGTVTDDVASGLTVRWSSDRSGELGSSKVAAGGAVRLDQVELAAGAHTISLKATDAGGAACDATVRVRVAGAPALAVSSPRDGLAVHQGQAVALEGTVSDPDEDAAAIDVTWRSDRDGVLGSAKAAGGKVALSTTRLSAGAHTLTAVATDTQGLTAQVVTKVSVDAVPTCAVTSPRAGTTTPLGARLRVTASAADRDDDPASLTATWTSSAGGGLGTTPVSAGTTALETDRLAAGDHELTLTVADPRGARCTSAVKVRVVQPPTLTVSSPRDGEVFDLGRPVAVVVRVSDADEPAPGLQLALRSSRDGALGAPRAAAGGEATTTLDRLSTGEHVLTWTALDAQGLKAEQTVRVRVNAPPGAARVSIPGTPGTKDDLVAKVDVESVDPEKGAVTYRYRWEGPGGGHDGATLPASKTKAGERWTVTVTPSDGRIDGPSTTASILVVNTPPTVASASITPGSPLTADALDCAAGGGADDDGDAVTFVYQWSAGSATLGGARTLPAASTTKGQQIVCRVSPSDGTSRGEPVVSPAVTIGNSAPAVEGATLSPAEVSVGRDVTCRGGASSDADRDAVQLRYAWTVDGRPAGDTTLLSGKELKKGQKVACNVTPFDGSDSGTAATVALVVKNSPPGATSAALSPAAPTTGDDIRCSGEGTSDPDGDKVSFRYQWLVDGAAIGETGSALPASATSRGQRVQCVATPTDGEAEGAAVRSAIVTVANTPPTASGASLGPAAAKRGTPLTCQGSGGSDPDGDEVSYRYTWEVDGKASGATGASLATGGLRKGNQVVCVVAPFDGREAGPVQRSSAVTLRNTAPTLARATLGPAVASASTELSCTPSGGIDADGDPLQYTYAWQRGGTPITGQSGPRLPAGTTRRDDSIACVVTPSDGSESGGAVTSNGVVVKNSPPKVSAVKLSPADVTTDGTLRATADVADPDGDPVTLSWRWFVDGRALAERTDSLDGANFAKKQRIEAEVTPSDGTLGGSSARSDAVVVRNSPPTLPGAAALDPRGGRSDLVCSLTREASDLDGDKLTYKATWRVGGETVQGTTTKVPGDTIPHARLRVDQAWTCLLSASDGQDSGPAATAEVTVIRPALAAGSAHTCALETDGQVSCWGSNALDQLTEPLIEGFRVLSSSAWHTCGVRKDATASCWGYNSYGQSRVPAGRYRDISAGAYHTCGVRDDGTLACWGTDAGGVNQPPGGAFVSVVSGWSHSCALTPSGTAQCWGDNGHGQATTPPGVTFTEISAGEMHTCGLTTAGTLQCWGANARGQLSAPKGTFVSVTSGGSTSCATAADGQVTCWGADDFRQARPPAGAFWNVDCSSHHCCGWTDSGAVKCWGRNDFGQTLPPPSFTGSTPAP